MPAYPLQPQVHQSIPTRFLFLQSIQALLDIYSVEQKNSWGQIVKIIIYFFCEIVKYSVFFFFACNFLL